jgi:hypothetical protein
MNGNKRVNKNTSPPTAIIENSKSDNRIKKARQRKIIQFSPFQPLPLNILLAHSQQPALTLSLF